jgi:hypothetical protein
MLRFRRSSTGSIRLAPFAMVVATIIAFGGVAFACGQGGGCGDPHAGGQGGDCQKNPDIVWTTPTSTAPSATPVTCSLSLTSSTLTVVVTHLAPGQACAFTAHLKNIGSGDAEVNEAVAISHPAGCSFFRYSDNVPTSPALGLAAGHSFSFSAAISLASGAGNACQGAVATILVTLTGTATTCDAMPMSGLSPVQSIVLWKCD